MGFFLFLNVLTHSLTLDLSLSSFCSLFFLYSLSLLVLFFLCPPSLFSRSSPSSQSVISLCGPHVGSMNDLPHTHGTRTAHVKPLKCTACFTCKHLNVLRASRVLYDQSFFKNRRCRTCRTVVREHVSKALSYFPHYHT